MEKKTLNIIYGIIWVALFGALAFYIYSGKLFEPDANGKLNIVAIGIAWIVEYVGQTGTAILTLAIGLVIGGIVAFRKDKP